MLRYMIIRRIIRLRCGLFLLMSSVVTPSITHADIKQHMQIYGSLL